MVQNTFLTSSLNRYVKYYLPEAFSFRNFYPLAHKFQFD